MVAQRDSVRPDVNGLAVAVAALAGLESSARVAAVELIEFGEVDGVAGALARALHLAQVGEGADGRLDARGDLDEQMVGFELLERRSAWHAIEDMNLARPGRQLDADRTSEIGAGQLAGDRVSP